MSKHLCKQEKQDRKKIEKKEKNYQCAKCQRYAHKEKYLCKPEKS